MPQYAQNVSGREHKRLVRKATQGKYYKKNVVNRAPLLIHGHRSLHFNAKIKAIIPLRDENAAACNSGTEGGKQVTESMDAKELILEPSKRLNEPPVFPREKWSTPRWTKPLDRGRFELDWDLAVPNRDDSVGKVRTMGHDFDLRMRAKGGGGGRTLFGFGAVLVCLHVIFSMHANKLNPPPPPHTHTHTHEQENWMGKQQLSRHKRMYI